MSTASWIILPVPHPELARLQLGADERVVVGLDFVAMHRDVGCSALIDRRKYEGPAQLSALPVGLQLHVDRRGLLALPDRGQDLASQRYEALVSEGVWLPIRSTSSLLLVPLSPRRAEMLRSEPDLVRDIVDQGVDDGLELGPAWSDYRRILAELARTHGLDPARLDVLPPSRGVALFEDATIELARMVEPEVVRDLAVQLGAIRCPPELEPVQSFYTRTANAGHGVLTVCFERTSG